MVRTKLNIEQTKFLTAITESRFWQINYPFTLYRITRTLKAQRYSLSQHASLKYIRDNYVYEVKKGNKEAIVKW